MPFDQGAQQVECARADRHRSGFAALAYAEQAATAPVEQEIAEQESFRCRIGRVRSSPVKAVSPRASRTTPAGCPQHCRL